MPRRNGRSIAGLPLVDLRQLVAERERLLGQLQHREQSLEVELAAVRREITEVVGGRRPGRPVARTVGRFTPATVEAPGIVRRRGRGAAGLTVAGALVQIVRERGEPMRVRDLAEAFRRSGHPTSSKNLQKLIAITIKNSKRFRRVARGLYTVK